MPEWFIVAIKEYLFMNETSSSIVMGKQKNIEDFAQKEIKKFLLIFQELISIANDEESSLEEGGNSIDSAVSILLILAQQIWELIKGETDSLEFPKIVKKSLLGVFNTVKNNIKSKLKTNRKN